MATRLTYQSCRIFSAEINLQNFLCMPTVRAMHSQALPVSAPPRPRPARRIKAARQTQVERRAKVLSRAKICREQAVRGGGSGARNKRH